MTTTTQVGARVLRPFVRGNERLQKDYVLSPDEVAAIPSANLRALHDAGYIQYLHSFGDAPPRQHGERVVLASKRAKQHYDVYEGPINDKPLSKDDALALAHGK